MKERSLFTDAEAPVLAAAVRTPIGRLGGGLKTLSGVALGAQAVRGALAAVGGLVPDHAMLGCVLQAA